MLEQPVVAIVQQIIPARGKVFNNFIIIIPSVMAEAWLSWPARQRQHSGAKSVRVWQK